VTEFSFAIIVLRVRWSVGDKYNVKGSILLKLVKCIMVKLLKYFSPLSIDCVVTPAL